MFAKATSYWELLKSVTPNLNIVKHKKIKPVLLVTIISFCRRMSVMVSFHNVPINLNLFVLNVTAGSFYPTIIVTTLLKIVRNKTVTFVPLVPMACLRALTVSAM